MMNPPRRVTVGKTNGLFLSWNIYRGDGDVTINPPLPKPWEDTRTSANSPGGLVASAGAAGRRCLEVTATFDEPGTYVMWGRADDGGLYHRCLCHCARDE